jgi:hypothetical protein
VMPQRKVEVFPKESRGLPKGKSRSSQRKVEVFPKESRGLPKGFNLWGSPNVEAIFTPILPPVGGGVRVVGIVVPMGKLRPSRLRVGSRRDS